MDNERIFTLQYFSAGWCLAWGLGTANPYSDVFAKVPKLYEPMMSMVNSEMFWGLLFSLGGVIAAYFAFTGRRAISSLVLGSVFIALTVLNFMGDPWSLAVLIYGYAGIVNLAYWVRRRQRGFNLPIWLRGQKWTYRQ